MIEFLIIPLIIEVWFNLFNKAIDDYEKYEEIAKIKNPKVRQLIIYVNLINPVMIERKSKK